MADKLEIIAKLQKGLTAAEVARLTRESVAVVEKVAAEGIQKGMLANPDRVRVSHAERAALRRLVADFVKERKGTSAAVAEAAQKFNMTIKEVRRRCRELGVEVEGATRNPRSTKAPQLVILATIIANPDAGDRELAEQLGVTKQYVNVVRRLANQAGVFLEIERAKESAVKEAVGAGGKSGGTGPKSRARVKKR